MPETYNMTDCIIGYAVPSMTFDNVSIVKTHTDHTFSIDKENSETFRRNSNNTVGVDRIIFNPPATIVFWKDGTKTVVKCAKGEPFSEYNGFAAALLKKVFGSNSAVKKIIQRKKQ